MDETNQKIVLNLWFNTQAEEAVEFYTSIFKNSRIMHVARYGEVGARVSGQVKGSVMSIEFELNGQRFIALNGGPLFTFSPAMSLVVKCDTQAEIDELWTKLSAFQLFEQCGWLKDKYGMSWQIVPTVLGEMMGDEDLDKTERVMGALMQMKKIDIQTLQQAYES